MTADEMFKELGYKKYFEDTAFGIIYKKDNFKYIDFVVKEKEVEIHNDKFMSNPITMQELQAINLKCKELGWI